MAFVLWGTAQAQDEDADFSDSFPLEDCHFLPWGGNDYFDLTPGRQSFFSNTQCLAEDECDELEELRITVTPQLKKIHLDGATVWTRVIEEYETADGELTEISRNYFATCWPYMDVYYFGEDVDIYEDGEIVSHAGGWLAGQFGAQPGMIMPQSAFLLGTRYYQEVAPGVALDRAEHVDADLQIDIPAGSFDGCVEVEESTPFEPGDVSTKLYCSGVGLVVDEDLEADLIRTPREHRRH